MKIRRLKINNFRAFGQFECEFEPGITVLTGLNSSGKTAVLKAIIVAAGQDRKIQTSDIRQTRSSAGSGLISTEHHLPVNIEVWEDSDTDPILVASRQKLKGRTSQAGYIGPICYYDSGRRNIDNPSPESLALARQALDIVLEPVGWSNVRYIPGIDQICADHDAQGTAPVAAIGGIGSVIDMVAGIAQQGSQLALIDGIDLHLHPKWQQMILPGLAAAFPDLQLIVTTHSPLVLSTVSRSQIRVLPDFGNGECATVPACETLGKACDDLLTEAMGN